MNFGCKHQYKYKNKKQNNLFINFGSRHQNKHEKKKISGILPTEVSL